MSGPRVQLIRGLRTELGAGTTDAYAWRLLGGNQRELGRSVRGYPDPALARDSALALQASLARAVAAVVVDALTGQWSWRLHVDDEPVLTSSRGYQRRRESESNLRCALAALCTAVLVPDVLDLPRHRAGRRAISLRMTLVHPPAAPCP